jgi:spore maturation protein CgeB
MLDRIVNTIEEKQSSKKRAESTGQATSYAPSIDTGLFAANMATLQKCFPEVYQLILNTPEDSGRIEVRHTAQGDVIWYEGQCLDHGDKPQAAGETWIKRLLTEERFKAAKNVVLFGGAGFYHVEALLNSFNGGVSVIEPVAAVFRAALRSRDLSKILPRVTGLVVGESETKPLFSTPDCELAVRPQSQAACSQACSRVRSTFYGTRGISTIHPTMAILGPIQGGTLPIGAYCLRALNELKQRGRYFDLSGFATGYHQMEQFLHDKMRQSVMQGNYVEMLSQVVLEAATEKPFDILICMAQAPASGRMLTELRKRGVITVLWFVEDYLRFPYWKSIAQFYDYVFTIQKGDCLSEIKKAGAGEVHYLPTACDPMVHRPLELTSEEKARWGSPISFVGAGYHNRQQTFASLANLPFKIWGTEWPECKPFDRMVQERGRRLTPEEYVKIFNASDINLNLHSSTERDGVDPYGDFINPRTFELASAGAFQLVDERTLLPELFEPGREVITFKNPTDLKDKIEYYKNRPEERKQVAARARERVLRDHTYANRLQEMISLIYSSRFEHLQRRLGTSAWNQMLRRAKQHDELGKRCEDSFKRGEEPILDGLVTDIVGGKGKMSETEMKLMFLYHVRKQIIKMLEEDPSK